MKLFRRLFWNRIIVLIDNDILAWVREIQTLNPKPWCIVLILLHSFYSWTRPLLYFNSLFAYFRQSRYFLLSRRAKNILRFVTSFCVLSDLGILLMLTSRAFVLKLIFIIILILMSSASILRSCSKRIISIMNGHHLDFFAFHWHHFSAEILNLLRILFFFTAIS